MLSSKVGPQFNNQTLLARDIREVCLAQHAMAIRARLPGPFEEIILSTTAYALLADVAIELTHCANYRKPNAHSVD